MRFIENVVFCNNSKLAQIWNQNERLHPGVNLISSSVKKSLQEEIFKASFEMIF